MEGIFGQVNDGLGRPKLGSKQSRDLDEFMSIPLSNDRLESPNRGTMTAQHSDTNMFGTTTDGPKPLGSVSTFDMFGTGTGKGMGMGTGMGTGKAANLFNKDKNPFDDSLIANPFRNPFGDFNPFSSGSGGGGGGGGGGSSSGSGIGSGIGSIAAASSAASSAAAASSAVSNAVAAKDSSSEISGSVRDSVTIAICWTVRLVRTMVLWIVIHFVDKYYQAQYLKKASLGLPLPRLWTLPLFALAAEAVVFAALLCMACAMSSVYKREFNTFVVDGALLKLLLAQYAFSTVPVAAAGIMIARVLQHSKALRYCEDGARAIRATSLMFFYVAVIAVALPVDVW